MIPKNQDQKPEAVKKYRSIMPKPVLVLPALASPRPPQPLPPGSLGHLSFDHSLAPKHLDWKEDGQPPKLDCLQKAGSRPPEEDLAQVPRV